MSELIYPRVLTAEEKDAAAQALQNIANTQPVLAAYQNGTRVFVEIGNGKVFSGLVRDILQESDAKIVSLTPAKGKNTADQLEFTAVQLSVLELPILDDPYRRIPDEELVTQKSKTTYTVRSDAFYIASSDMVIALGKAGCMGSYGVYRSIGGVAILPIKGHPRGIRRKCYGAAAYYRKGFPR